jgi:putative ABC transport system permease protein
VEVYGLSGGWVDKLAEFIGGGEFDKDLFLSGDYAIISKTHRFNNVAADGDIDSFGGNIAYHQPGDKINLVGIDRELTVLAVTKGTAFTCIGEKKQIANRYELYLPAHIVKGLDNTHLMSVAVFTNDLPVAEDGIKALIHGMGGLTLMSVSTYMQVFNSQIGSLTTIALGLAILLCIVGMVNFINTSATAIIARQYELSALESIGMTKTQVEGMIITECLYMGGIALTLAALLSYPFSKTMIGTMVRENGFVEFTYAWQPILGWLIFICCAGVVTSLATYQNIARGSISERLAV